MAIGAIRDNSDRVFPLSTTKDHIFRLMFVHLRAVSKRVRTGSKISSTKSLDVCRFIMEVEITKNEMENDCNETVVKVSKSLDDEKTIVSCKDEASVEYVDLPVKLATDKKAYRGMKLANGFTAMLIADISGKVYSNGTTSDDKEEKKCASEQQREDCDETLCSTPPPKRMKREQQMAECGISVGVGNLNDPPKFPSLTRLLEHALVIGSKKYPQHFAEFANNCGGWYNAYTSAEKTTFKFAVPEKFLLEALDRFAEIFGNPVFDEQSVARLRRQFVALRDNVTVPNLCSQLRDLWECRYRPHNIIIAIEARLPLDVLEDYVKKSFSTLSNAPLPDRFFEKFRAADLINITGFEKCYGMYLVSGKNNKMEFNWTMPSIYEPCSSRCFDYVLSIMRHKGRGSLHSYLRNNDWCSKVSCEIVKSRSNSWILALTIDVTSYGSEKTHEIMRSVYSYVNLIRKEGPQLRTYHEICQVEAAKARFSDAANPIDNAFDLCESMNVSSPIYCTTTGDDSFDVDRLWIKACIDSLIPENGNIVLFDRSNKDKSVLVEPWFRTKYTITEFSKNTMQFWKSIKAMPELHLPEPNIFIAEDFSLMELNENSPKCEPVKIRSDGLSEIWYQPQIVGPICHINVYYVSPLPLASPENAAMLDVFVEVLKTLMDEELYPAGVAGLNYSIESGEYGLIVKVNGYNDKLPLLVQTITKYIARCYTLVTKDLFKEMKNYQRETYGNQKTWNAKSLLEDVHRSLHRQVHWTFHDKHTAVSRMEFDRFQNFAKYYPNTMYVQFLVEGNMTSTVALDNAQRCIKLLRCRTLLPGTRPQLRNVEIPIGEHCCRIKNMENDITTVTNYYQMDMNAIKLSLLIELLREIQKAEPDGPLSAINVFELREQTDSNPLSKASSVCGFTFADDWGVYPLVHDIDDEIEVERRYAHEHVKSMSEQDFARTQDDLFDFKAKKYFLMDLPEDVRRNWSEIVTGRYDFDRPTREMKILKEFTTEDMRKGLLEITGTNLRKLSVQVVAIDVGGNGDDGAKTNGTIETNAIETDESSSNQKTPVASPMKYFTKLPNEKNEKPSDYYITDVFDYKCNLTVLPLQPACKI